MAKPMTAKQKRYANKVAAIGCIVSYNMGYPETPAEIHHVYSKVNGKMRNHDDIIPLSPQFHRCGRDAVHVDKKLFEAKYGTEAELLEQVKELLNE